MLAGMLQSIRTEFTALADMIGGIDRVRLVQILLAVFALAAWGWAGWRMPAAVIASPYETAEAFFMMLQDRHGHYLKAIASSLQLFFGGFGLAGAFGIALAMLMVLWPILGRALHPIFDLFASVPNIAFMPLVVALLGLGLAAKTTVVFLAAILPVVISAHVALRQVPQDLIECARDLGEGAIGAQLRVTWPLAQAGVIAGLRLGATQGLSACVIAELYTAMTGLGGQLSGYANAFNMPRYFVSVITLALIGITVTLGLRALERALSYPCKEGS